jgi:hypothetical protein
MIYSLGSQTRQIDPRVFVAHNTGLIGDVIPTAIESGSTRIPFWEMSREILKMEERRCSP